MGVLLHQHVNGLASSKVSSFKLCHDGTNGDARGFASSTREVAKSAFNSNSGSLLISVILYLLVRHE